MWCPAGGKRPQLSHLILISRREVWCGALRVATDRNCLVCECRVVWCPADGNRLQLPRGCAVSGVVWCPSGGNRLRPFLSPLHLARLWGSFGLFFRGSGRNKVNCNLK